MQRKVITSLMTFIALIAFSAANCQFFDRMSPVFFYNSPDYLKKMRVKSIAITSINYEDDVYQDRYVYNISKSGKKLSLVVQLLENQKVSEESLLDTFFFSLNVQSGYECPDKLVTPGDSLIVCDLKRNRILSKGRIAVGNYEEYEYDRWANIKCEYSRLWRVERIPYCKKNCYNYDSQGRLKQLSYYENDSASKFSYSPLDGFMNIPFALIYEHTVHYFSKSYKISHIIHRQAGELWTYKYQYSNNGLLLSVKIFNNSKGESGLKAQGAYNFEYSFY